VAVAASVPAQQQRRASLPGVLVYWHLLSLDAPTVAVVWAWAFARAGHVQFPLVAAVILGIGTWLVYIADRLLDVRAGASPRDLRERHFFHARHRHRFLFAGCALAIPLVWLVLFRMYPAARREDIVLFLISSFYFALVHGPSRRIGFPREVVVGLVFASACAVPAWARMTEVPAGWLAIVPLFAALCWLNCAAIHVWERDAFSGRARVSASAVGVAGIAALLAAALFFLRELAAFRLALAALASALLLLALDRDYQRRFNRHPESFSPLAFRILADITLLTPLLFVMPWRI
jgi:hypothetical protein